MITNQKALVPTKEGSEAELSSASNEQLAEIVISGCVQFKKILPYVAELRERFAALPRGNANIAGCKTWTEFCEKKLDRTDRAVRKALRPPSSAKVAPRPAVPSDPAEIEAERLTELFHENNPNIDAEITSGKDGRFHLTLKNLTATEIESFRLEQEVTA
jgi:hypothetical protein